MALKKQEIENLIRVAESEAVSYCGENSSIAKNRAMFLDRYYRRPFGDEKKGMSSVVMSNTFNVIEGMLPPIVRMFAQGNNVATFQAKNPQYEEEAEQKTALTNYVFEENGGLDIIYTMIKDGLLSYTGWVKVSQKNESKTTRETYRGLSEIEVQELVADGNSVIASIEKEEDGTHNVILSHKKKKSQTKTIVENVPPEECVISRRDRDFKNTSFIGQRTPKTRSQLVEMGFKKSIVDKLAERSDSEAIVGNARSKDEGESGSSGLPYPASDVGRNKAQEQLWLGEYYMLVDVDEDGVSERWQFFYCDNQLLKMTSVDDHPYSVFVPIPMPHRAIGTCPAESLTQIEHWHTSMVRSMNNNVYATNHNRFVYNDNIDLDDALTPRHGGGIYSEGTGPVQNNIMPMPVMNQVPAVLESIQYIESEQEKISGITAYNQGMDTESLNKTATGFQGIRDMSMMRIEVIARQVAKTIESIFNKIAKNAYMYQNEALETLVFGEPMEIAPQNWREGYKCKVDAGIGSGDMQQKVANLNMIAQEQKEHIANGTGLADTSKLYHTYDKLCLETGLKDAAMFFNDTNRPPEILQAENEQLKVQLQQLQQQLANPLVQAERDKAEASIIKEQMKLEHDEKMQRAKLLAESQKQEDNYDLAVTKMELEYSKDLEGGLDGVN